MVAIFTIFFPGEPFLEQRRKARLSLLTENLVEEIENPRIEIWGFPMIKGKYFLEEREVNFPLCYDSVKFEVSSGWNCVDTIGCYPTVLFTYQQKL